MQTFDQDTLAPLLNFSDVPTYMTGADAGDRLAYLTERLAQRDVTVDEVREFIVLKHQPHMNQAQQPLDTFITEQMLSNYWWLYDWWEPVENKPATLPSLRIQQFLWHVNYVPGSLTVQTFDDALRTTHQKMVAHCIQENIDTTNPGESAEDRKRRRNRERMALARGHLPTPKKVLKDNPELSAKVRELEAQCEELKDTAKQEDNRLREDVIGYQRRMIDASAERKATALAFKERIENLRTEIRALTAKQ